MGAKFAVEAGSIARMPVPPGRLPAIEKATFTVGKYEINLLLSWLISFREDSIGFFLVSRKRRLVPNPAKASFIFMERLSVDRR